MNEVLSLADYKLMRALMGDAGVLDDFEEHMQLGASYEVWQQIERDLTAQLHEQPSSTLN